MGGFNDKAGHPGVLRQFFMSARHGAIRCRGRGARRRGHWRHLSQSGGSLVGFVVQSERLTDSHKKVRRRVSCYVISIPLLFTTDTAAVYLSFIPQKEHMFIYVSAFH